MPKNINEKYECTLTKGKCKWCRLSCPYRATVVYTDKVIIYINDKKG